MLIVWLLICGGVIYWLYSVLYARRKKYPPGPTPIPFIGHFLKILNADAGRILLDWKEQYGKVYTIYFTSIPAVIIADADMQKEYMKLDSLTGRMQTHMVDLMYEGYYGIVFTEGETWREQRRFSLHVLRDLGLGKAVMEQFILNESKELIQHLKDLSGMDEFGKVQAVRPKIPIQTCVVNIISGICFGNTFARGDPILTELCELMKRNIEAQLSVKVALLQSIPLLQYIPLWEHFGADVFKEVGQGFGKIVQSFMDKAELSIDDTTHLQSEFSSLTEAFVKEMKKRRDAGDLGTFTPHQLKCSIIDLFAAGFETTVVTLHAAILRLVHEQDIQQEIYEDMIEIGGGEVVTLSFRPKLTKLNAFIMEVQRTSNVVPFSVPHKTITETEIGGYSIPANTVVMYPSIAIHNDPHIFPDPYKFDITRFTGEDRVNNSEYMRAFGIGKRQCIGENLARAELFLILADLIHNFHIKPVIPQNPPSLEFDKSRPFAPIDYQCIFEPRM